MDYENKVIEQAKSDAKAHKSSLADIKPEYKELYADLLKIYTDFVEQKITVNEGQYQKSCAVNRHKEKAAQRENKFHTDRLKGEIAQGILAGENPLKILTLAVECISLLSSDTAYKNSVMNDIKMQGLIFENQEVINAEIHNANNRLEKMREYLSKTQKLSPYEKMRLQTAITEHENRIKRLQKLLEKGENE